MKLERTAWVLIIVGTGLAISSAFAPHSISKVQALVALAMVAAAIAIDLWSIKHRPQPSEKPTSEDGVTSGGYIQGPICEDDLIPARGRVSSFFTNAADLTEADVQAFRERWDAIHGTVHLDNSDATFERTRDCHDDTCSYPEPHRHGFACDKACIVCGGH